MTNKNKLAILYHKNCSDGFLSGFLFWKAIQRELIRDPDLAEFIEVQYEEEPPGVDGRRVFVLDFSYPPEVLKKHFSKAISVEVLDHHLSAYKEHLYHECEAVSGVALTELNKKSILEQQPFSGYKRYTYAGVCCDNVPARVLLMNEQSGAGMTLDYLDAKFGVTPVWTNTDEEYIRLNYWVDRIEDRDLWRFKYEDTKAVYEMLNSIPRTFKAWDTLLNSSHSDYIACYNEAAIRVKMREELARSLAKHAEPVMLFDQMGVAVNTPSFLASEVGAILSEEHRFAIMYTLNSTGAILSFRSKEGVGADVSEITGRLGGGGHLNSAGVRIDTAAFINKLSIWTRSAKLKTGTAKRD